MSRTIGPCCLLAGRQVYAQLNFLIQFRTRNVIPHGKVGLPTLTNSQNTLLETHQQILGYSSMDDSRLWQVGV